MKRVLWSRAAIGIGGLALASCAAAQEIVKLDYVRSRALMGGEAEVLDEGSLWFAADGRFRRDVQRHGERTTEILLPDSRQRITMNHALQVVQSGAVDGRWPIPSRYVPARPSLMLPKHLLPEVSPEARRYMRHTSLGRRDIGGIVASGSRNARVLPDGRQTIIDTWLTPLDRAVPIPIKVEEVVVSRDADGVEVFREQMHVVSFAKVPLTESFFKPVSTYEAQNVGRPRPRVRR